MIIVRSDSTIESVSALAIDGASVDPLCSITSAPEAVAYSAVSRSPSRLITVTRFAKSLARTTADAIRNACARTTKTIRIDTR